MKFRQHPTEKNDNGFTVVELIILILATVVIVLAGFFVYQKNTSNGSKVVTKSSKGKIECNLKDGINFCVQASSETVSPSDVLAIKATLENQSNKTYSTDTIYSSSCNEPSVTVNGKVQMNYGACTADITSISIESGKTKTYNVEIDTSNLKQGSNTILLKWNGEKLSSKSIDVQLTAATKADKAKSESCIGEQSAQPYCANVLITFKEGTFKEQITKCEDLEAYIKPLGLKAEKAYCNLADIGIISVYVPKDASDQWIAKIKQLPQVEDASLDR